MSERVRGVGPLSSAWKAEVIPVYDTRVSFHILTRKHSDGKQLLKAIPVIPLFITS